MNDDLTPDNLSRWIFLHGSSVIVPDLVSWNTPQQLALTWITIAEPTETISVQFGPSYACFRSEAGKWVDPFTNSNVPEL